MPTRMPRWLAILLVSAAGLLLEVGYTRIISFKLWYYYTYLVIGLALLGIGSGGVLVALSERVRLASTERIVARAAVVAAVSTPLGYLAVARVPVDTVAIWDYGTRASLKNLAALALVCLVLFATFIALGVIVSVLLGRAGDAIGRIYFADLVGAGAGCLAAIPLISALGAPAVVAVAALLFAVVGVLAAPPRSPVAALGALAAAGLVFAVVARGSLPDVRVEAGKIDPSAAEHSEWGPVFRVDVVAAGDPDGRLLAHDGTYGSGIRRFDGDVSSLDSYGTDARAIPFDVLGGPPDRELIIGSAGGNEILASLSFGATDIVAVELNPVTVGLLTDEYADFTGHLPDRPEVDLIRGDGRSFLARSDDRYDLVWFVAPDSYAANNAASSGAFVLSESYLYTTEMIQETLRHLTDDGIMVVQFGELAFEAAPKRTARYVVTARDALTAVGADDPSRHLIVSALLTDGPDLSTIVVKRTPLSRAEVARFTEGLADLPGSHAIHAPGVEGGGTVALLATGTPHDEVGLDAEVDVVEDDAPFFWHFSPFGDVLGDILRPITLLDVEDVIGERVLLLLLGLAAAYAAVFLLLPFAVVRRRWGALPATGTAVVYFACLGLGFMLYEITMIQRLSRFLGYPTYSLTVTLAALLLATGVGALLSHRLTARPRLAAPALVIALTALTAFYRYGLDELTDGLLDQSLAVRVAVAVAVLAPLGLALGLFMPLGLTQVARLTEHGQEYVAWAWAVNGFFSVIGSVLTTILAMTYGFRDVQAGALAVYAVAVVALTRLRAVPSVA